MSGYPGHQDYDDGYGHHPQGNPDSYYDNEQGQYYDQNVAHDGHHAQQGEEGYYDES